MKPPIAGVTPQAVAEATVMTVWPSNSAYAIGRTLGKLYASKIGFYIFTVGNLIAVLSIPIAILLFFYRLAPYVGTRYRLTNRRIVIQKGLRGEDDKSVPLDGFDSIDIDVREGQRWYNAGDLVFRNSGAEVFRLVGVSRPEAFRQTCVKSHTSFVGVQRALHAQAAPA